MTAPEQTQSKRLPRWRDLLALPLALLGSLTGCFVGARLFFYIWDRGPFIPGVVGLCTGLTVLLLTRRGGFGAGLIPALATTIMQLILHHQARPIGLNDFYTFLYKLSQNLTLNIVMDHAIGILLAGGIAGLLPLLWKKR